jgi:phosphonate transport system substrate-binding protein
MVCVMVMLVGAVAVGCNVPAPTDADMETLRIGLLPGESRAALEDKYSPLKGYLEQQLGVPCQLVSHDSYEHLQLDFEKGLVDIAWLGGYMFVNVNRSHGAIPLVSRNRDFRFTSYFLVRADESASELADFRGKKFAFGSRLSTSGHLMPRHFLQGWKMDPDEFFGEVHYTGTHDKTAFAVRDGEVDIGVASAVAVESMIESGRLSKGEVRILRETPPYIDCTWACQASLSTASRAKLRDAFLNLTKSDPAHAEILSRLHADYYFPTALDEFRDLQRIVDVLALAESTE